MFLSSQERSLKIGFWTSDLVLVDLPLFLFYLYLWMWTLYSVCPQHGQCAVVNARCRREGVGYGSILLGAICFVNVKLNEKKSIHEYNKESIKKSLVRTTAVVTCYC